MNEEAKTRVGKLSDKEIAEIWMASRDPENPTPDEKAAIELMEERNIDF